VHRVWVLCRILPLRDLDAAGKHAHRGATMNRVRDLDRIPAIG
jgi:hypothetical protein